MTDGLTFNISGATIVFANPTNNSTFITSVLLSEDQSTKKEIIAIADNQRLKDGLFRREMNKSGDVLEKFAQWGANPEDIIRLSNFLNDQLTRKELTEKEKSIKGNLGHNGIGGEYTTKEKINPV